MKDFGPLPPERVEHALDRLGGGPGLRKARSTGGTSYWLFALRPS